MNSELLAAMASDEPPALYLDGAAGGMCATILPLTRGRFTVIDERDEGTVARHRWCFHHKGYAVRMLPRDGGKQRMAYIHRVILAAPDGSEVDHRNRNTLDNRRSNLRLCTVRQNAQNRRRAVTNRSGYRGVHWAKYDRKWKATIRVSGRKQHLGYFVSAEDAARAYDQAALRFFGEFASLNFSGVPTE